MATPQKAAPTAKEKEYASRVVKRLMMVTLMIMTVSAALVFMGFTYVVVMIVVSILPAVVASIVDRRPRKYASKTVTCFNLSGVLPVIFDIFMSADPDATAQVQLADPYVWMMVYGFAGFGWLVVYVIPQMVFLFLVVRSDHTIARLEQKRKALVEEWGDRVRGGSR
jgi:small-conductance mechanosensitive channel